MLIRYFYLIFFIVFCVSCGKKTQKVEEKPTTTAEFSTTKKHMIPVSIKASNEKEIVSWEYYTTVRTFLQKFQNATPNEALGNALELTSLVKALKDSVKPEMFRTRSLNARINLLENEALRLSDMTKISAIKAAEVNAQIDKVLQAFSSLNSKINTVYLQQNLSDDISFSDFDPVPLERKEEIPVSPKKKERPKKNTSLLESLGKEKPKSEKLPFKDNVKRKREALKKKKQKKS